MQQSIESIFTFRYGDRIAYINGISDILAINYSGFNLKTKDMPPAELEAGIVIRQLTTTLSISNRTQTAAFHITVV